MGVMETAGRRQKMGKKGTTQTQAQLETLWQKLDKRVALWQQELGGCPSNKDKASQPQTR